MYNTSIGTLERSDEIPSRGAEDATLFPRKPCGRRGPELTPPPAASRILLRVLLQPVLQVRAGPAQHHAFATMTTGPPWSRKLLTDLESMGNCHRDRRSSVNPSRGKEKMYSPM